tara:strand:- start:172 stop:306 length:135 start_codon:yes stop_codon:yes gene_type:complete
VAISKNVPAAQIARFIREGPILGIPYLPVGPACFILNQPRCGLV